MSVVAENERLFWFFFLLSAQQNLNSIPLSFFPPQHSPPLLDSAQLAQHVVVLLRRDEGEEKFSDGVERSLSPRAPSFVCFWREDFVLVTSSEHLPAQ